MLYNACSGGILGGCEYHMYVELPDHNASALYCNARHAPKAGSLSGVPDTRFIVYKRGLAGPRLPYGFTARSLHVVSTWYL